MNGRLISSSRIGVAGVHKRAIDQLLIGFKETMRVVDSVQIFHRDRRDKGQDSLLQGRGEMVQARGIRNHSKKTGSELRKVDPGLNILSGLRIL